MNKDRTKRITFLGLMIGLVIVMSVFPFVGYIPFGPISITIIHIPVLIGAYKYKTFGGFVMGLAFGISSFLIGVIRPQTIMDAFFINPLVSILPRVLYGTLTGLLFSLNSKDNDLFSGFICIVTTLIHTILVMSSLYICYLPDVLSMYPTVSLIGFVSLFLINGLLEGIVGAIITVIVIRLIRKQRKK